MQKADIISQKCNNYCKNPGNIRLDEDVFKTIFIFVFRRRVEDVLLKTNVFILPIRLQDVLQKRLQDIFKTSCKDVFKTFSRRIIRLNFLPRSHF